MGQAPKKTYGLQLREKTATYRPRALAGSALVQSNREGEPSSPQEKTQTIDAARRVMATQEHALKGLAKR